MADPLRLEFSRAVYSFSPYASQLRAFDTRGLLRRPRLLRSLIDVDVGGYCSGDKSLAMLVVSFCDLCSEGRAGYEVLEIGIDHLVNQGLKRVHGSPPKPSLCLRGIA